MTTMPPTPVTTVKPLAAALFLTRSGGFAWVRHRSDAPLIAHRPWVADYQEPGVLNPGRYGTRRITIDDDGSYSASRHPCQEDLVRLCAADTHLSDAAGILGAYLALLRLPHSAARLRAQWSLVELRDILATITGETAREVQDRCEELTITLRKQET